MKEGGACRRPRSCPSSSFHLISVAVSSAHPRPAVPRLIVRRFHLLVATCSRLPRPAVVVESPSSFRSSFRSISSARSHSPLSRHDRAGRFSHIDSDGVSKQGGRQAAGGRGRGNGDRRGASWRSRRGKGGARRTKQADMRTPRLSRQAKAGRRGVSGFMDRGRGVFYSPPPCFAYRAS